MPFVRKHFTSVIFGIFLLILILNPFGLGLALKVKVIRLLSFGPSEIQEDKREVLQDYNWVLQDLGGNSINFNEHQDKVILVNFWATWCPPCVAEMPSLEALYSDYKDKIEFVIVAEDQVSKTAAFLQENNYTMPILFQQSPTPALLESRSLPTTFLLDKNGNVVIKKKGAADWNSTSTRKLIESLL